MKTLLEAPNGALNFEAIYVTKGNITFDILMEYDSRGMVYWSNGKRSRVTLHKGDLLLVHRPVARQIVKVEHGTKYTYISAPWAPGHIVPTDILMEK